VAHSCGIFAKWLPLHLEDDAVVYPKAIASSLSTGLRCENVQWELAVELYLKKQQDQARRQHDLDHTTNHAILACVLMLRSSLPYRSYYLL
jgi:hypothetical protein